MSGTGICLVAVALLLAACIAFVFLAWYNTRREQADAADQQACNLTRPDDDAAFLATVEADLARSRAVRRLARRLENTR